MCVGQPPPLHRLTEAERLSAGEPANGADTALDLHRFIIRTPAGVPPGLRLVGQCGQLPPRWPVNPGLPGHLVERAGGKLLVAAG